VDTLTLTARGYSVTLFAPRRVQGGLEAFAFFVTDPLKRPRTVIDDTTKQRFTAPAGVPRGCHIGRVFLPLEG